MAHPRDDEYSPPVLARLFHSFPHFNISLHRVNATFQPKNEIYLESLGILGSIPAAWLILTLLVLLIYLLTRCCDRKPRPRHSIVVLKWILAIFTLLCCAAIGVGLYGNDDVHNGIVQFIAATRNIDEIITAVHNQTTNIESTLSNEVQPILNELDDLFDQPIVNQTIRAVLLGAMSSLRGNTSTAIASIQEISRPLQGVDMKVVINIVQTTEIIRWPVTMGVLSVLLVFCVVLLFGVARHSRCALITFSVFGLFAVIISWILASVYLATSVALGDLCTDPEGFLYQEAGASLRADVLKYYVRCESMGSNPFSQRVLQGQRAVKAMASSLAVVTKFSEGTYPISDLHPKMDILTKEINKAGQLEASLAALLDCTNLHRQYLNATRSVCDLGLYGLTFMLVASVAAGFFFTVLVWVDSHTWIYIRKRRDYLQVDEQDPFLPPSAASQAIAARTLRSQGSYGSTGYFRSHPHNNHYTLPPSHPTDTDPLCGSVLAHRTLNQEVTSSIPATGNHDIDGRSSREEKPQHGPHYVESSSTLRGHEYGAPSVHGPNHGQYATLSKQCKTLESSDFY